MISWIQRTFQQHFKWLFLLLLVLVIISFVFITNASSGLGHGGAPKVAARPFFDLNLAKQEDIRRLIGDAQLSLYLRQSAFQPQPSEAEVEQYALQRYAALHYAAKLGIAAPTTESPEFIAYVKTLGRFTGPDGQFDRNAYSAFADELKKNPRGFTEADVARVLLDDVRAETYEKLLAGPGYVLASDLAEQLARRDTRWTLALASIDGKTFAPKIDTSETALAAWFENNARRYEIPPRVSVAAVVFPAARFADTVKLTDAQIRAHFDANPDRYPAPEPKAPAVKIDGNDKDALFAAVRAQVEADLRKESAEKAALAAADDLTVKLLEQRVALDRLPAFLASKNLALEDLGPVGPRTAPAGLGGDSAAPRISPEALRLSAERPYSNPIPTPTGAAVLVWRENLPARVPALAEVREKALADYQAAEKRRLFSEAGRKLRESVASALAAGKPFADALKAEAAAAGLKVEIKTPATFSLSGEPPQDIDFTAFQALGSLAQGGVSDFLPSRGDTGLLVHAIKKETPPFDPASPAAAEVKSQMAPVLASRNAQGMLAALVEAELMKSRPVTE